MTLRPPVLASITGLPSSLCALARHDAHRYCRGAARSTALQGWGSEGQGEVKETLIHSTALLSAKRGRRGERWAADLGGKNGQAFLEVLNKHSIARQVRQEKVGSLWAIVAVCKRKELGGKMYSDNDV